MSVDSGVKTGNDSNDSSILTDTNLFIVNDDPQISGSKNKWLANEKLKTMGKFSIDMDNIKWPTQIGLGWCKNLHVHDSRCETEESSLEDNLLSPSAGKLFLPRGCLCNEVGHNCNQLKWCHTYKMVQLNNSFEITKDSSTKVIKHNDSLPFKITKNPTYKLKSLRNRISKQYTADTVDYYLKELSQRKMRMAVATNNIELMTELLRNGISPNCFDDQGRTPLHHAACRGYTEMVRILLENGADPNQCDCIGNTPLHLAAVTSKISVVTLLLGAGTDVHQTDKYGYNPLQLALTKLKLFQYYKSEDMIKVKEEMRHVVDMLMMYFKKQEKDTQNEVEMLSDFCSRLSLSNTSDQVQSDIKDLLTNINALSITS